MGQGVLEQRTQHGLIERTGTKNVPTGTRTIRVVLQTVENDGAYSDAIADNISLTLGPAKIGREGLPGPAPDHPHQPRPDRTQGAPVRRSTLAGSGAGPSRGRPPRSAGGS